MKKILVGLMCGVAATAASAVDLHIASMAANGRLVEIIDVDSIAREKHVTRVNVISVVHKLGSAFVLTKREYDCKKGVMRPLQQTAITEGGVALPMPTDPKWIKPNPDSAWEGTMEEVCRGPREHVPCDDLVVTPSVAREIMKTADQVKKRRPKGRRGGLAALP